MSEVIQMIDLFDFNYLVLLRLAAAFVFGGIIGMEREGTKHEAGLRTHIIVCLGAATIMVLSELLVAQYGGNTDIMRMGAQVISGIGFLGVGCIIVDGNRVRGITTAAGIWTTACIGLVLGAGYYLVAFTALLLVLFAMHALRRMSQKLAARGRTVSIAVDIPYGIKVPQIIERVKALGIDAQAVKLKNADGLQKLTLEIVLDRSAKADDTLLRIADIEGVTSAEIV